LHRALTHLSSQQADPFEPSRTPPQIRARPLLGMSDDFPLIMPPVAPIAT
jgi:hypothetical protein